MTDIEVLKEHYFNAAVFVQGKPTNGRYMMLEGRAFYVEEEFPTKPFQPVKVKYERMN